MELSGSGDELGTRAISRWGLPTLGHPHTGASPRGTKWGHAGNAPHAILLKYRVMLIPPCPVAIPPSPVSIPLAPLFRFPLPFFSDSPLPRFSSSLPCFDSSLPCFDSPSPVSILLFLFSPCPVSTPLSPVSIPPPMFLFLPPRFRFSLPCSEFPPSSVSMPPPVFRISPSHFSIHSPPLSCFDYPCGVAPKEPNPRFEIAHVFGFTIPVFAFFHVCKMQTSLLTLSWNCTYHQIVFFFP